GSAFLPLPRSSPGKRPVGKAEPVSSAAGCSSGGETDLICRNILKPFVDKPSLIAGGPESRAWSQPLAKFIICLLAGHGDCDILKNFIGGFYESTSQQEEYTCTLAELRDSSAVIWRIRGGPVQGFDYHTDRRHSDHKNG